MGSRPPFVQYSVHSPNEFICLHIDKLLPNWESPVLSVLVVLQKSQTALLTQTLDTEAQKQQLRQYFIAVGHRVAAQLYELGYLADLFDPQTGLPLLSQPGQLRLDDVAVVQACLGYSTICHGGCVAILHPIWGGAVYPSILVSSAQPSVVQGVIDRLIQSFQ